MYKEEIEIIASFVESFKNEGYPVGVLIKALEKQIPVKPSYENEHGEDMCPICNFGLNNLLYEEYGNVEEITVKYCPNCGQRLDWEEN